MFAFLCPAFLGDIFPGLLIGSSGSAYYVIFVLLICSLRLSCLTVVAVCLTLDFLGRVVF